MFSVRVCRAGAPVRCRRPAYPTAPQRPAASWPVYYFAELQPVVLSSRMQRSQSAPTRSLDQVPRQRAPQIVHLVCAWAGAAAL